MTETDEGQCATPASFARGAIFASMVVIALPALISVSILVTDRIGLEPHREIVDINTYPWSSIGKLGSAGHSSGQLCTGAVIGPNQILTAAHCLYNERTARFVSAGSIHFLLGYIKGEYRVHRVASRYIVPPTFEPTKIGKLIEAFSDDWAILYTSEPFPPDMRPLRLASATPSSGKAVKTGGYPAERLHMMTADQHCQIRAISTDGKLLVHDCVIHHGDSGGPLLSGDEDEEGLILGINVGGYTQIQELHDQSRHGGLVVSTTPIAEFLARQVVGALTQER